MAADIVSLSKILNVRKKEKNDAQKVYQQSTDFFEDVATKLYTILKKKEVAEKSYDDYLQSSSPIDKIKEQATYIEHLNKQIISLQHAVTKARNDMELNQGKLTEAHVEVKKFEKIIKNRHEAFNFIAEKAEKASMDEISIQQYVSRKVR